MDSTALILENDLADALDLSGPWKFRLADAPPMVIPVPSAWEAYTRDKITDGPAFYSRTFDVPDAWRGRRIVLEAQAISFDATIRVNGHFAGHHRGMWSPFQVDLTPFVGPGENALEIEVWKPGGRFPLRECLAGFLPDVCTTFGGVWQSPCLRAFTRAAFSNLKIITTGSGRLEARGDIVAWNAAYPPEVAVRLLHTVESEPRPLATTLAQVDEAGTTFTAHLEAPGITPWTLDTGSPSYTLEVSARRGSEQLARVRRPVAFRDVAVMNGRTHLNSQPLHVRGVLDWGWDNESLSPNSLARRQDHLRNVRALGFNMVKFCLFVPDESTFEAMDREGMLVWLEMPMWLPRVTPEFRDLARREYHDVFRRVHHHPSLAILSLGCELNAEADADFLHALHDLAREWLPNALICDNSGSAEAYGGALTSQSDFHDYHFYTDPHFFQPLVRHFSRAYRPGQPWIFGEFCDADTLRDFSRLQPEPWWLVEKVALERDDYLHMRDYRRRLSEAGISDGGAELTRIARQQATSIRKFIVEQVRTNSAAGGYVVTGWMDTPITTSGVVDDFGQLKCPPDEWRTFNADRVLTMDRERRRRWVGGDRPARRDPFCWRQGEQAEIHLVLSNGGGAIAHAQLEWQLSDASGVEIARGGQEIDGIPGGEVVEVAVLRVPIPRSPESRPVEFVLRARLTDAAPGTLQSPETGIRPSEPASLAHNTWRLWAVPKPRLPGILAVEGPLLHRHPFARIDPDVRVVDAAHAGPDVPLIAADLTDALLAKVQAGHSALLWQMQPDARFTRSVPFWREAIHVFAPHPFWERVPHTGYADMRFFSVATDFAIDQSRLMALLGPEARGVNIWRRFDARAMTWAEYLLGAVLGKGQLWISTLRFEGGLGSQPDTFEAHPVGAWMLATLLGLLAG
jgi:hypothetical protein